MHPNTKIPYLQYDFTIFKPYSQWNTKTSNRPGFAASATKKLYGRSDKVFCDIHCKNKYHSDVRKHTKSASAVNTRILNKNYEILCLLLGDNYDRFVIKRLELKKLGFNFETISGMANTRLGLKFDIFEFSWYYTSKDNIVILQDREQSKISPFMYKRWERHLKPLQTDNPEVRC